MEEQEYFQYQKRWERPFIFLSKVARKKMFDLFMDRLSPCGQTTVLDVGVTSDTRPDSNFFEWHYPFPHQIICTGLHKGREIIEKFSGVRFITIGPEGLPFRDKAFDIGVSFAVIEHVGNKIRQRDHISELLRVCRRVFVTTPNRAFPIDPHTMVPLLHYLPNKIWRKSLAALGRDFYSSIDRLNPLNYRELRSLFPPSTTVKIEPIRICNLTTNLIAIAESTQKIRIPSEPTKKTFGKLVRE